MQIGQRLGVIEPVDLGHEALDQLQHAVGAVDEAAQQLPRIDARLRAALIEPALGARGVLGRRQPDEGQEIAALEMRAVFLELRPALGIDQRRRRIGKARCADRSGRRSAAPRRRSPSRSRGGAARC